ncbi:hypothetical protein FRC03_000354 [Tulasnella sp. 419]|nr:hypothetical protein FRC03_000354 [Tulasnella sp. 419]
MVTVQLRGLKIQEFDTRRWFLHHANHPFLHTFSISTQPAPRETLMGNQDRIDVIGYLGRHPTITKLEVNGKQVISSTYGDPSTFLPNLQIAYFAEPDHINLARDRPLTVVCIGTYFTHTSHIKLAQSYLSDMGSTLLALDLSECLDHWQGLITEGLEKLLSNLPRLRYFGLAMKRRDWGGANLQDIMRTCLPTVKILRFNLVEYEARGAREENMKNFFAASESLKWVMITSTYNWAFIPQVRTREDPSGGHVNKSELRRDLWDIGIRLEHWEDAMMLIRRCVVEGGTL